MPGCPAVVRFDGQSAADELSVVQGLDGVIVVPLDEPRAGGMRVGESVKIAAEELRCEDEEAGIAMTAAVLGQAEPFVQRVVAQVAQEVERPADACQDVREVREVVAPGHLRDVGELARGFRVVDGVTEEPVLPEALVEFSREVIALEREKLDGRGGARGGFGA